MSLGNRKLSHRLEFGMFCSPFLQFGSWSWMAVYVLPNVSHFAHFRTQSDKKTLCQQNVKTYFVNVCKRLPVDRYTYIFSNALHIYLMIAFFGAYKSIEGTLKVLFVPGHWRASVEYSNRKQTGWHGNQAVPHCHSNRCRLIRVKWHFGDKGIVCHSARSCTCVWWDSHYNGFLIQLLPMALPQICQLPRLPGLLKLPVGLCGWQNYCYHLLQFECVAH